MAETGQEGIWKIARVPTGVPNLDRIIDGGLTRGDLTLVAGGPGAGKTVLAEQMTFHWANQGQNVLWLVTLGEPNEKFLIHLSDMDFFDRRHIGAGIQLVNLTHYLLQGSRKTLDAIRKTLLDGSYSFVIIDGFQSLRCFLQDQREIRLFLSDLGTELALAGISLIVTADIDPRHYWEAPELTMADCVIALDQASEGGLVRRQLHALKLRGRPTIGGLHTFTIDSSGLHIYPRIESILPRDGAVANRQRQPFGLPEMDSLMGGGLLEGVSTLVLGSQGTGKSLLASYFLAGGLRASQPALQVCFAENLERYLQRAEAFGLPLRQAYETGMLAIHFCEPGRWDPDRCIEHVVEAVEQRGVRRLVLDGIELIEHALAPTGRTQEFIAALIDYLRLRGVTALFTYELPGLFGLTGDLPLPIAGQLTGNLILLRLAEVNGRLRRFLNVVKTRYSEHSDRTAELLFQEGRLNIVPGHSVAEEQADMAPGPPHLYESERLRG